MISNQYLKIYEDNLVKPNFPYDIYILLLSPLYEYSPKDLGISDDALEYEEIHLKYFNILKVFFVQDSIDVDLIIKHFKALGKEKSITCLKLIGKIINKSCFILNEESPIIRLYNNLYESLVAKTNFFNPTENIVDANMLIFILSIGYGKVYDKQNILKAVINYLLLIIEEGKINSQLIINCLTLLILKHVVMKPDTDLILNEMFSLGFDEDQILIVKEFFVKAYYLFK